MCCLFTFPWYVISWFRGYRRCLGSTCTGHKQVLKTGSLHSSDQVQCSLCRVNISQTGTHPLPQYVQSTTDKGTLCVTIIAQNCSRRGRKLNKKYLQILLCHIVRKAYKFYEQPLHFRKKKKNCWFPFHRRVGRSQIGHFGHLLWTLAVDTLQKGIQPRFVTCTAHLPTELSWLFLHSRRKTGSLSEKYGLQELCRGGVWFETRVRVAVRKYSQLPPPRQRHCSLAAICGDIPRVAINRYIA